MAPTIPFGEPTQVTAGDTIAFKQTFADFDTSTYTVKYRLVGGSIDSTATASESGETYTITFAASVLASIVAETTVRLFGWAENSGATERYALYDGTLLVKPNLATATATNLKSHAVRCVAIIEAALEDRLTADMENYSIDGRAVQKIPAKELRQLLGFYRAEVWREQNPGRSHPSHAVRFVAAG